MFAVPDMDSFTARLAFLNGRDIGQTIQVFLRNLNALGRNAVVHPLALLAAQDDAGIAENLHMVGQGWLTDAHFLQKTAGALLPAAEQFQDLKPVFIAKGLKHFGGFFI